LQSSDRRLEEAISRCYANQPNRLAGKLYISRILGFLDWVGARSWRQRPQQQQQIPGMGVVGVGVQNFLRSAVAGCTACLR